MQHDLQPKILFNGANGRMGKALLPLLRASKKVEVVACTGKEDNLADAIKTSGANIAIDFTTPQAVFANAKTIINSKVHPIIGSSGLLIDQTAELKQICAQNKLGGLIVPNFSISALLMQHFAKQASHWFETAEIIERHHVAKKDAPSATALHCAKIIEPEMQQQTEIHSQRLPGVFAEQQIVFANPNEHLIIEQRALNRACMLDGLILACEKVLKLDELQIGLEQFLFCNQTETIT